MARRFFENAAGPSSSIPAVTPAVPFSAVHLQNINGSRQATPSFNAAQMSSEPLDELWKARGSPRLDSVRSPVPAAWAAGFGSAGHAVSSAVERQLHQNGVLTKIVCLLEIHNVYGRRLFFSSVRPCGRPLFELYRGNRRHVWTANVRLPDDAGAILRPSSSH